MGIDVKGLNKKFIINKYAETIALDNVNISFERVGSYLLFGKSGSGKSTFLKIIYGLLKPDSGGIYLNNKKIDGLNEYNTIYVPQDYGLIENLTVIENLRLALNGLIDNEFENKVTDIFKKLEIDNLINQLVKSLSGGERAKVAFSRIILSKADVILLDEPTASIDKDYSLEVYKFIQKLSKEKLVIVVSHDERIKEYVDNIIYIKNGKIDETIILKESENKNKLIENKRKINDFYSLKKIYKNHNYIFCFLALMIFSIVLIFSLINLMQVQEYQIVGTTYENSDVSYLYSENEIESEYLNKYTYYDYSIEFGGGTSSDEYYYGTTLDKLIINDDLDDGVICVSDYTLEMMIHTHSIDYLDLTGASSDGYKTLDEATGETFTYNDYDFTMSYYDTNYENHTYEYSYDTDYLDYEDSIYMMSLDTFKDYYTSLSTQYFFEVEQNDKSTYDNSGLLFFNEGAVSLGQTVYANYYTSITGETVYYDDLNLQNDEIVLTTDYFNEFGNIDHSQLYSYIGESVTIDFSYGNNDIEKNFVLKDIYDCGGTSSEGSDTCKCFVTDSVYNSLYLECLGDEENTFYALDIDSSYVYTANTSDYTSLFKYIYSNNYSLEGYYNSTVITVENYVSSIQSLSTNLIKIFLSLDLIFMVLFIFFEYKFTKKTTSKLLSYGYLKKDLLRFNIKLSSFIVILTIPILVIISYLIANNINSSIVNIIDQEGTFINYIGIYSVCFYLVNIIIFLVVYNLVSLRKLKYKG